MDVLLMNNYQFKLIFQINPNENAENYLDLLFEAGCDDALFGLGRLGNLGAEFTREADSAFNAIKTAIEDVTKVIPHAKLIKADPYIMNLSEMAYIFGCTKQNLSKYARGYTAVNHVFPRPIICGKIDYWYVIEVSTWLQKHTKIIIDNENIEIFDVIHAINLAIEVMRSKSDPNMDFSYLEKKIAA